MVIFDGGFNNHGAYGSFMIFCNGKLVSSHLREIYPVTTSNQAEYYSLVSALSALYELAPKGSRVRMFGDSRLIINQVIGRWRAIDPAMVMYRDICREYLRDYDWEAQWWPREQSLQFFEH